MRGMVTVQCQASTVGMITVQWGTVCCTLRYQSLRVTRSVNCGRFQYMQNALYRIRCCINNDFTTRMCNLSLLVRQIIMWCF